MERGDYQVSIAIGQLVKAHFVLRIGGLVQPLGNGTNPSSMVDITMTEIGRPGKVSCAVGATEAIRILAAGELR